MKVLLLNGSPHKEGCTYTALCEVANVLNQKNIETEIFYIGTDVISPCRDCRACAKLGKCVIRDKVNEFLDKAETSDGFIFGSPVHYASASGIIVPFLDRAFYADSLSNKKRFYLKPGAAVISARRAGTTATLDQLNKYFLVSEMPIISSGYWNMVHGWTPEDVRKDEEGLQTMRILGTNMAWFLEMKEFYIKSNHNLPNMENYIFTNFIR